MEFIKSYDARVAVELQLKTAIDTNKEQEATIIRQKAESMRADLATADLTKQLDDMRETNTNQAQLIEDLGRTDAKVKDFNALNVPNSLRKLLNKSKRAK